MRTLLTAELVSITPAGLPPSAGSGPARNPAINATGRYIAFQSSASNLVAGLADGNAADDVFVRDLLLDRTIAISVADGGGRTGDGPSFDAAISDDGRFVAFVSAATNLIKEDVVDSATNVYVRDRDADRNGIFDEAGPGKTATRLLSVATDGTTGDGPSGGGVAPILGSAVRRPVISGDGKFVAFASLAADLALDEPGLTDFNGAAADVFRASTGGGPVRLISINVAGTGSGTGVFGAASINPSISGAGLVAFESSATDLVSAAAGQVEDDNLASDIFVGSGRGVTLVSVSADEDGTGDGPSREAVISRNGLHVAFISKATDLVRGATDANGIREDIFVRDLRAGRTALVSRSRAPGPQTTGDEASPAAVGSEEYITGPTISDDGRFVAFQSAATNLLDPADGIVDDNGKPDVFVFDRDADGNGIFDEMGGTRTILASVNSAGTASVSHPLAGAGSFAPTISGNGRFVAFLSTADDMVPGVDGTQVYLRDLETGAITVISTTTSGGDGGVVPTPGRSVGISRGGDRVTFISPTAATDLDPLVVADPNMPVGGLDVFAAVPPPDLRTGVGRSDGFLRGSAGYAVAFGPAAAFGIGIYRSADAVFDSTDELLGTIPITDADDLSVGRHPTPYPIGTGPGEIPLPGTAGGPLESDDDYLLLQVADHLDAVAEFDDVPFAEDNTGLFLGAYHEPGGLVFVHGRDGEPGAVGDDRITIATTGSDVTLSFGGPPASKTTYALADLTGFRIRTHGGDDTVLGSDLPDVIFGGAGDDSLTGGPGDDTLFGGPGDDMLVGGPGVDTFFDGPGDDTIVSDEEDEEAFATPGSHDQFMDHGGSDTLNFSRDDQPITLDLDSAATQQVDPQGNTVQLVGQWENFVGSPFRNTLYVRPLSVPRRLVGGAGAGDVLYFNGLGLPVRFEGSRFQVPGFGDVVVEGFERIETWNAAPRIIDDSDAAPAFTAPGFFASDPAFPQGFDGGVRFSGANSGNTATWHFDHLAPGRYMVSATWTFAGDRAKNAPFTFRDGGPTGPVIRSLMVNQEQNPGEFDPPEDGQNILFRNLSVVQVTGNQLTVQLTDVGADQFVAADAIRIDTLGLSHEAVIDDGDAGFTSSCPPAAMANNAGARGAFGDRLLCGAGGDESTWVFGNVPSGLYYVAATWTPDPTHPVDAAYVISAGGEDVRVEVDQQQPPAGFLRQGIPWQVLGVFDPGAADLVVRLEGNGVADAVLVEKAPQLRTFFADPSTGPEELLSGGQLVLPNLPLDGTTGQADALHVLLLRNTGLSELTVDAIRVDGTGFEVVNAPPFPRIIPPFGSETFEIAFQAGQTGAFPATVTIEHRAPAGGPFRFDLIQPVVIDALPPTVSIVAPPGGASVIEGTSVQVQAEAHDDLGVARVEFLACDQCQPVVVVKAPYVADVPIPIGVTGVAVKAIAVDRGGNNFESPPVTLNVLPDEPPAIRLVSPDHSSGVVAGQPLLVEVEVSDDVALRRVEFSACDQCPVVPVDEEPFLAELVVPAGVAAIQVRAVAIDHQGQQQTATAGLTVFATPIVTPGSVVVAPDGGPDDGLAPPVRVLDDAGTHERFRFFPYGAGFRGGVRVATGDVSGDGVPDIVTGAGPGGAPHVKVFNGVDGAELRSFFAFPPSFTGGVSVAAGELNGDGIADIIVGAGPGAPGGHVRAFDGASGEVLADFQAFATGFAGGVRVAAGDVDGDGRADIVVGAGPGSAGAHVKVFHGVTRAGLSSFFAFGESFTGGVSVAAGDLNSDGTPDVIVTPDGGGSPAPTPAHVRVFDGLTAAPLDSFFAFSTFGTNLRPAAGDMDGDGRTDLVTAGGPGLTPHVNAFAGTAPLTSLSSFFALDTSWSAGVFVAAVPAPAARHFTLPPGGGTFELLRGGNDIVLRQADGIELNRVRSDAQPLVAVRGAPNADETLVVLLDGLPVHVAFHGGLAGNDELVLQGGPFSRITHLLAGPDRGNVQFDGLQVTYTGLEPVRDEASAPERVFIHQGPGNQKLRLADDPTADDGFLSLDPAGTGAFETVTFASPTASLTLQTGEGHDVLEIGPLDSLFLARIATRSQGGDDLLRLQSLSGTVSLQFGSDRDTLQLASSGAHLDLTDAARLGLHDLEVIDLVGQGANSLTVTRQAVLDVTDAGDALTIRHDADDTVQYDPAWVGTTRQPVGGETAHGFVKGDATLTIVNTRRWQNPTQRVDVDADGFVVPFDVLRVINVLNAVGSISLLALPAGTTVPYVDVQADDFVAPLDALAVVNFLNARQGEGSPEELAGEGEGGAALQPPAGVDPGFAGNSPRPAAAVVPQARRPEEPAPFGWLPSPPSRAVSPSAEPPADASIRKRARDAIRRRIDPPDSRLLDEILDGLAADIAASQQARPSQ